MSHSILESGAIKTTETVAPLILHLGTPSPRDSDLLNISEAEPKLRLFAILQTYSRFPVLSRCLTEDKDMDWCWEIKLYKQRRPSSLSWQLGWGVQMWSRAMSHIASPKLQCSLTGILICKVGIINDLTSRFAMRLTWKAAFKMLCLTSLLLHYCE